MKGFAAKILLRCMEVECVYLPDERTSSNTAKGCICACVYVCVHDYKNEKRTSDLIHFTGRILNGPSKGCHIRKPRT